MFNEILSSECFTILRFGHVRVCVWGGSTLCLYRDITWKKVMMMQTGSLLWLPIEKLTLSLQQVSAALPALKSVF